MDHGEDERGKKFILGRCENQDTSMCHAHIVVGLKNISLSLIDLSRDISMNYQNEKYRRVIEDDTLVASLFTCMTWFSI